MSALAYQASPIKRVRSTRSKVQARRRGLYAIVAAMRPMTVRQVFYQATVRDLVDKSEAGYTKVQTDLVLMRRAGVLPYDWLADNTRWQRKPVTFDSVQAALAKACPVSPGKPLCGRGDIGALWRQGLSPAAGSRRRPLIR